MTHRTRVLGGLAVLLLSLGLTGCGQQSARSAAIEFSPVTPTPTRSATGPSASTVDAQVCFDVAEAYSGLELLPLSDRTEEDGADEDALRRAHDSVTGVENRLPAAVRPAFAQAQKVLSEAGDTLQPAEAAQVHRALEPAESWLQTNCAEAPPS